MPKFAILIADPDLAHAKEIERNIAANVRASGVKAERVRPHVERMVGPKKQVGDLHAEADSECPEGMPNCRNCGDPAHAATCRADGHCPDCGTKHGIAPDSVVAANGYRLEAR